MEQFEVKFDETFIGGVKDAYWTTRAIVKHQYNKPGVLTLMKDLFL